MRSACVFLLASTVFGQIVFGQINERYAVGSFSAKLVLEDGTPLPRNPLIELGHSEKLYFDCKITGVFLNGTITYLTRWPFDQSADDTCPVRIRLTGYRMTDVALRDHLTVVLKRENSSEGATVSATSLKVPEDASKAYNKGVRALNDQKWPTAERELQKAVSLYPDYAQAWKDLGEVLQSQGRNTEAEDAFQHALKADPKYLPPYLALAKMNLDSGKNQEASALTTKALALNQGNVPLLYFYDALASSRLTKMADAERSARTAVEIDTTNQVPRAEYLLGMLLATRGQNKEAVTHLQNYLKRDPKTTDAAKINDLIDRLSK
jgi:Tfp pilus assembly protein PilF